MRNSECGLRNWQTGQVWGIPSGGSPDGTGRWPVPPPGRGQASAYAPMLPPWLRQLWRDKSAFTRFRRDKLKLELQTLNRAAGIGGFMRVEVPNTRVYASGYAGLCGWKIILHPRKAG